MIWAILQHTPVWVWALFCGLFLFGLYQRRTLQISRARATIFPLAMMGLSFSGLLSALGLAPVCLGAWVIGLWLASQVAAPLVEARGATWSAATGRYRVPGSWAPLAMILGVFLVRYSGGVTLAVNPHLLSNTVFAGGLSLVYGFFAGLFWARARSLHRLVRRDAAGVQPA